MKKILLINDHAKVMGGADVVAYKQYRDLLDLQCEVEYANADILEIGKYEYTAKNFFKNIFNYKAYLFIKDKIKKFDPDIILVHSWTKQLSSSIFMAAKSRPIHIIAHDYFLNCPNGGLFNYRKNVKCNLTGGSFSCILENCDKKSYLQKIYRLVRFYVQNYILINPNIIVWCLNSVQYDLNSKRYKVKKLKNPIGAINLSDGSKDAYAYVGRADPEKGTSIFEKIVIPDGKKFIVIGPNKNNFPKINNALYYGWLNHVEIKEKYSNIRACIFSSVWLEVDPLTPFELMTGGVPVISSSSNVFGIWLRSKIPELVYDNIEQLNRIIGLMEDNNLYERIVSQVVLLTFNESNNRSILYERFLNEIAN